MLTHLFFIITLTRGISILKDLLAHGSQTGSSRAENLCFLWLAQCFKSQKISHKNAGFWLLWKNQMISKQQAYIPAS